MPEQNNTENKEKQKRMSVDGVAYGAAAGLVLGIALGLLTGYVASCVAGITVLGLVVGTSIDILRDKKQQSKVNESHLRYVPYKPNEIGMGTRRR